MNPNKESIKLPKSQPSVGLELIDVLVRVARHHACDLVAAQRSQHAVCAVLGLVQDLH